LPLASGVPALGLTRMFEYVILENVEPVESTAETVKVIVLAAGVAVEEVRVRAVPAPAILVTVAVTVEAVSNTNPEGAFNTIVPVPISLPVLSSSSGPVKVVHAAPVLSAEMAEPPVAAVMPTAACAWTPPSKTKQIPRRPRTDRVAIRLRYEHRWCPAAAHDGNACAGRAGRSGGMKAS